MFAPLCDLEICLDWPVGTAQPGWRALRFAATVAAEQGARIVATTTCDAGAHGFYVAPDATVASAEEWAQEKPGSRVVLQVNGTPSSKVAAVSLSIEAHASEAILFAASGLADLNGRPDGPPLVPSAHYAAHTIGYAVYAALVSLHATQKQHGRVEHASLDGLAVMQWINWKAISAGMRGETVTRAGALAEWPVLECADGHVALLFAEREWPAVLDMVNDPDLNDPRFATFKGRQDHRAEYLPILQRFCKTHRKAELRYLVAKHEIPGDSVRTIDDLLKCELFHHRQSFTWTTTGTRPKLPERVIAQSKDTAPQRVTHDTNDALPLSGLRVLDLGIITAGAGVSAVLADLGAEVLKIESSRYPDPFRKWAGSSDSPLFRFNNRNKFGLDIDLKTPDGKAQFLSLVKDADIVVENFRRGVIERLGLGFDDLSAINPRILLASISGQGHTGPGTHMSTFGSTLEANAGFSTLTRDARGQPFVTGLALNFPDQVVCLYGAGVIAAAAIDAQATGIGRHLDVSQRDTVLYQIGDVVNWVAQGNDQVAGALEAGIGRPQIDTILTCADGVFVALHIQNNSAKDTPWAQGGIQAWAEKHVADDVIATMAAHGHGAAVSLGGIELARNRFAFDSGAFAKDPKGNVVKGFPFQFRNVPMTIQSAAPQVGEHNAQVFKNQP